MKPRIKRKHNVVEHPKKKKSRYVPLGPEYVIEAAYRGGPNSEKDALIRKVAKIEDNGSGYSFLDSWRDHTWTCTSAKAACALIANLRSVFDTKKLRIRIFVDSGSLSENGWLALGAAITSMGPGKSARQGTHGVGLKRRRGRLDTKGRVVR